jgi:hypothetical protein
MRRISDNVEPDQNWAGPAAFEIMPDGRIGDQMKKLTLSFWLALAAAGVFVIQAAGPGTFHFDDPAPTCPPDCADPGGN